MAHVAASPPLRMNRHVHGPTKWLWWFTASPHQSSWPNRMTTVVLMQPSCSPLSVSRVKDRKHFIQTSLLVGGNLVCSFRDYFLCWCQRYWCSVFARCMPIWSVRLCNHRATLDDTPTCRSELLVDLRGHLCLMHAGTHRGVNIGGAGCAGLPHRAGLFHALPSMRLTVGTANRPPTVSRNRRRRATRPSCARVAGTGNRESD